MWHGLKSWALQIKRDVVALWIAARDPRTPWYAKAIAIAVAAYALSPIDLIPDFIPIIGYLDDLVILPLGIILAIRLVPPSLMQEFRVAAETHSRPPSHWSVIVVLVTLWVAGFLLILWWLI